MGSHQHCGRSTPSSWRLLAAMAAPRPWGSQPHSPGSQTGYPNMERHLPTGPAPGWRPELGPRYVRDAEFEWSRDGLVLWLAFLYVLWLGFVLGWMVIVFFWTVWEVWFGLNGDGFFLDGVGSLVCNCVLCFGGMVCWCGFDVLWLKLMVSCGWNCDFMGVEWGCFMW